MIASVGCALAWFRPAPTGFERAEQARLHAHFGAVLAELSARDVSRFDPARRAARAHVLELLRQYDSAGKFPRNEGQRGSQTPIFVDRHGTRCAMAYLIEQSGGAALVARIAATRNLARIPELKGDQALGAWLAETGLDLAEAARVQPSYGPPPPNDNSGEKHFPNDNVMDAGTFFAVGFGVPAVFLNVNSPSDPAKLRQAVGFALVSGSQSVLLGLLDGFHDGHLRSTGYIQLAIGSTALTLGLLNLRGLHHPRATAAAVDTPTPRTQFTVREGIAHDPQVGVRLTF